VTTPSKLGPIVLSLFGLPFLGFGLVGVLSFLQTAHQPLAARMGAAVFASVFAIIGGGLIFGSCYGYALQKKQAAREQAQPASPWLWREDWAAGRAKSNQASVTGWWVGAALANMLCLPFALGTMAQGWHTRNPVYLFPAGLALLGLLVFAGAIRATLRRKRYGQTYFEIAALPFSPGGRVAGAIHLHLDDHVAHGVDLRLTCFRRIVIGTGRNRSSQQVPLWEASKNVPAAAFARGPLDTRVPVEFQLPADAFQTDHENSNDQVLWLLQASADVPGVDYRDEFELPVFRTSVSAATATATPTTATDSFASGAFVGAGFATGAASMRGIAENSSRPAELSEEIAEPARHQVVVEDSPGGLEFRFRAGRNLRQTLLVVVLAAVVGALFYGMLRQPSLTPFFAFAVVGLLDFVLILAAIRGALMSTRITVGDGRISWRRSILGLGRAQDVQISEVDSVTAVTTIQQTSSSRGTLYSLRLKNQAGKNFTLVDEIASRDEARWIVAQIEKRAGLRLNTQVAIDDSFYGPPPQPGAVPGSGGWSPVGSRRVAVQTGGGWSLAIAAILFLVGLGVMGLTMSRASHSRTPVTRRPVPQRVAKPSAAAGAPHSPATADPHFAARKQ
jgi:hypothetical protein